MNRRGQLLPRNFQTLSLTIPAERTHIRRRQIRAAQMRRRQEYATVTPGPAATAGSHHLLDRAPQCQSRAASRPVRRRGVAAVPWRLRVRAARAARRRPPPSPPFCSFLFYSPHPHRPSVRREEGREGREEGREGREGGRGGGREAGGGGREEGGVGGATRGLVVRTADIRRLSSMVSGLPLLRQAIIYLPCWLVPT